MIIEGAVGALLLATPAPEALILSLSSDTVEIESNFTGASIAVFGAIDGMTVADPEALEIVIVVRGPEETVTVRRRERVLGLWLNAASRTLDDLPAFYSLHASAPLGEIADEATREALGLGLDAITVALDGSFAEAAVRLRREDNLFDEDEGNVEWLGAGVFRVGVELPANVPIGDYAVEAYLFDDGVVAGTAERPLTVVKTGTEQFIAEAAFEQPWLYAIVMVSFAVAAGWLGGVIFRRD